MHSDHTYPYCYFEFVVYTLLISLKYVCYPATTVLYATAVGYGSFELMKYLELKFSQRLHQIRIEDSMNHLQETARKIVRHAKSTFYDSRFITNMFTYVTDEHFVTSVPHDDDKNKLECIMFRRKTSRNSATMWSRGFVSSMCVNTFRARQ